MNKSSQIKKDFNSRAISYGSWFESSLGTKYVDKLEKKKVKNLLNKFFDQKDTSIIVAEIGAGNGRLAKYLLENLNIKAYYAVDFSEKMVEELKKLEIPQLKPMLSDGTNFKTKKRPDAILSIRQIKYNKNYRKQIENMSRLIKKNGIVIIEFPSRYSVSGIRSFFTKDNDVLFEPKKLKKILKRAGFKNYQMEALRYLPDNISVLAKGGFGLFLMKKLEGMLSLILPTYFAKSILLIATK